MTVHWDMAFSLQSGRLKMMLLVAWTLVLSCLASPGQTNSATVTVHAPRASSAHWFPPPEGQMLKLPVRPEEITPKKMAPSAAHETFAFSNKQGLNTDEAALVSRVVQQGLLDCSVPTYNSDIQRRLAEAFEPKIVKVGHMRIHSTIIDAIARKNPLCLLNPQFFNASF